MSKTDITPLNGILILLRRPTQFTKKKLQYQKHYPSQASKIIPSKILTAKAERNVFVPTNILVYLLHAAERCLELN